MALLRLQSIMAYPGHPGAGGGYYQGGVSEPEAGGSGALVAGAAAGSPRGAQRHFTAPSPCGPLACFKGIRGSSFPFAVVIMDGGGERGRAWACLLIFNLFSITVCKIPMQSMK